MFENSEKVGIILAGGRGTRLWPTTLAVSKQLLPVAGRPMINFPLSTLMLAGVREVVIVCSNQSFEGIQTLFGSGSSLGISITYKIQEDPSGIPSGFALAADSAANRPALAILGDNFFYGPKLGSNLQNLDQAPNQTTVFLKKVSDVRPFGAAKIDENQMLLEVREKPENPQTNLAVTGLYFLKPGDLDLVADLKPSPRGETEIVDLLRAIMKKDSVTSQLLSRSTFWSDLGTYDSISAVEDYVNSIESSQMDHVLIPELVAVEKNLVSVDEMNKTISKYPQSYYRNYLLNWLSKVQG